MSALEGTLEPSVDRAADSAEWDRFVESTPGGHHVQSSAWPAVKALQGWRAERVVVRDGGQIAGGCQLLLKDLPVVGALAYAPRAPLLADRSPEALDRVLGAVHALARRERVAYLKLQPPADRDDMGPLLERRGFVASEMETTPTATVIVDLQRPARDLLADMRSSVRRNLRRAERHGVTARWGDESDLDLHARLVDATARRQRFDAYPAGYYRRMWEAFAPGGHAHIVVVHHDDAVLSSMLAIGFGDTFLAKMGAWSGDRPELRSNELMFWSAMLRGQELGYRWFDFEGIEPAAARAAQAGAPIDAPEIDGLSRFKLGFGGRVVVSPGAFDYGTRPLLRAPVRLLAPRLNRVRAVAHRAMGRS